MKNWQKKQKIKKKFADAQIAEKKVGGGVTQTKDFFYFSLIVKFIGPFYALGFEDTMEDTMEDMDIDVMDIDNDEVSVPPPMSQSACEKSEDILVWWVSISF